MLFDCSVTKHKFKSVASSLTVTFLVISNRKFWGRVTCE
jgi:hypothetical protein